MSDRHADWGIVVEHVSVRRCAHDEGRQKYSEDEAEYTIDVARLDDIMEES